MPTIVPLINSLPHSLVVLAQMSAVNRSEGAEG